MNAGGRNKYKIPNFVGYFCCWKALSLLR